jgi:hypothetical protein
MAPIRSFIDDAAAFDAAATAALSRAFTEVCETLKIAPDRSHDREVVAIRIIELARSGVVDACALRDRVLQEARTDA